MAKDLLASHHVERDAAEAVGDANANVAERVKGSGQVFLD
jgi:hypothetical protein